VANVEVFGSDLAPFTTADEGAVKGGRSSTDRTLSGLTLEGGASSGVPTSASSIEMPAIDRKGPLELRGREDRIINGEIGRASLALLFNRPTCASLKSPGSTPKDEHMIDIAQVDFSHHSNPISSGSVYDLNPSSSIPCSGVIVPNYKPLIRGTWIEKELPTGGPPKKLSTRLIHFVCYPMTGPK